MKYAILFLFVLLTCSAHAQQKGKTSFIPEKYSLNRETPLQFQKGDTLIIQCDEIFLINKVRFDLYKKLHANIMKTSNLACQTLVESLEQELVESNKAYQSLLVNCEKRSQVSDELIERTISDLSTTHEGLKASQISLKESIKRLEATEERLGDIKRENFNQKLLTGAAGVGLGILIGILVSN